MNNYEAKQEARRERYAELAEKNRRESDAAFTRSHNMLDAIPFGQPILIGHHSESRDRNYRNRAHNLMGKAVEASKTADYYERKAESVGTGGISSDDPDAPNKIAERIAHLEARQARMKAINSAHTRYLKKPESLDTSDLTDAEKQAIRTYKPAYSWEPHPYAPYEFQNLGGNIRRLKQRLESLKANAGRETKEIEHQGFKIVHNAEANRVQILFDGKPPENVRTELKQRGFRWSPMEMAWQRQLNNSAIYYADNFAEWYAKQTA